jgi:hypothetical protein
LPAQKRDEEAYRTFICLQETFPNFIYYSPNILNPSKPIHEVEEAKCNGITKEKHA